MPKDSLELFSRSQEGSAKFDYFVCGISGALFAYIGQTYTPQPINFSVATLEPTSLIFLVVSFFAGLKRIEAHNVCLSANHKRVELMERIDVVMKTLSSNEPGPFHNAMSAEVWTREDIEKRKRDLLKEMGDFTPQLDEFAKTALRYYQIRNSFLACGFVCLLLSKILLPYSQAVKISQVKSEKSETRESTAPVTR